MKGEARGKEGEEREREDVIQDSWLKIDHAYSHVLEAIASQTSGLIIFTIPCEFNSHTNPLLFFGQGMMPLP